MNKIHKISLLIFLSISFGVSYSCNGASTNGKGCSAIGATSSTCSGYYDTSTTCETCINVETGQKTQCNCTTTCTQCKWNGSYCQN